MIVPEFDNVTEETIIPEVYNDRIYDKYQPLTSGMIIVDVGAHVGVFSFKAAMRGWTYENF